MNHRARRSRVLRGASLIEVLTASLLSVLAIFTAVSVMIAGMSSWAKGQGQLNAQSDSQNAVRMISNELREAMAVTVIDGRTLEYRLPQKDSSGSFVVPATWDGVTRRFEWLSSGEGIGYLRLVAGSRTSVITKNVILRDPQSSGFTPTSGGSSYNVFTAGSGSITRQLTIMLVTRSNGSRTNYVVSRSRETVFLRNIPSLTR